MSGNGVYGQSIINADLRYDAPNNTLWMAKPADISFNRVSGTHRDFPFDSANLNSFHSEHTTRRFQ